MNWTSDDELCYIDNLLYAGFKKYFNIFFVKINIFDSKNTQEIKFAVIEVS